jgi:hydroxyacid-oxoacid transhydrogenase
MERDTAFEMAVSNIRFGQGITREVGMDLKDRGLRRVMVLTDAKLKEQSSVQTVLAAIEAEGVEYALFDAVRVEPTTAPSTSHPSAPSLAANRDPSGPSPLPA